jgi:hypothetical protein
MASIMVRTNWPLAAGHRRLFAGDACETIADARRPMANSEKLNLEP